MSRTREEVAANLYGDYGILEYSHNPNNKAEILALRQFAISKAIEYKVVDIAGNRDVDTLILAADMIERYLIMGVSREKPQDQSG